MNNKDGQFAEHLPITQLLTRNKGALKDNQNVLQKTFELNSCLPGPF